MGGSSAELRLPKVVVAVDLARAGRPRERAQLFVVERSGVSLAVSVAELLEQGAEFLPVSEAADEGGASVALVRKRAIMWVAIPLADGDRGLELFDHDHAVAVELDVGDTLRGHVLYSSPADRPRLADHLNLPVHFLRVWTAEALYLVNKEHVVRVLELT